MTDKQKLIMRPEKKVRRWGYEYTLVECDRGNIYPASFMGLSGYVLKSVRRLKKDE
jgi:hypothetical protein